MPGCAAQDPDQLRQWLYWVARTRKTLAREWGYGRDAEIAQRLFEIEEALMWVYCHLPDHGPVQDMQRAADCVCSMVNDRPDRYPLPARASNQWLPLTDATKKNVHTLLEALYIFRNARGTSWYKLATGWLPRFLDRVVESPLMPTLHTGELHNWMLS